MSLEIVLYFILLLFKNLCADNINLYGMELLHWIYAGCIYEMKD